MCLCKKNVRDLKKKKSIIKLLVLIFFKCLNFGTFPDIW